MALQLGGALRMRFVVSVQSPDLYGISQIGTDIKSLQGFYHWAFTTSLKGYGDHHLLVEFELLL